MRTITRCLLSLGLVLGLATATVAPASATPSPPYGTWVVTGNIGLRPPLLVGNDCQIVFAHGNSGGRAYAKMSNAKFLGYGGSQCFTGSATNAPGHGPCGNLTADANYQCVVQMRMSYRLSSGAVGIVVRDLFWGQYYSGVNPWNVCQPGPTGCWVQADGPPGSTIYQTSIYVSALAWAHPTGDPAVYAANPALAPYLYLAAWFNGV